MNAKVFKNLIKEDVFLSKLKDKLLQLKEDFKSSFRDQKMAEQMQSKIIETVKITPTEVKAYYNKIPKDSLPFYESEVELSQATKEVEKATLAIEEAETSKDRLDASVELKKASARLEAINYLS